MLILQLIYMKLLSWLPIYPEKHLYAPFEKRMVHLCGHFTADSFRICNAQQMLRTNSGRQRSDDRIAN